MSPIVLAAVLGCISGASGVMFQQRYASSDCAGTPVSTLALSGPVFAKIATASNPQFTDETDGCFIMKTDDADLGVKFNLDGPTCEMEIYQSTGCSGDPAMTNTIAGPDECNPDGDTYLKQTCVDSVPAGAKDVTCLTWEFLQPMISGSQEMFPACVSGCDRAPMSCAALQKAFSDGCAATCKGADIEMAKNIAMFDGDSTVDCNCDPNAAPAGDTTSSAAAPAAPSTAAASYGWSRPMLSWMALATTTTAWFP
eukprot:gnl/TRDRNA2_/TRDRNA2_208381_c0_seq1.p1 gnl/TRDRNA2_/TRDRNA2_208381_c0~~gnl/TRDRNA2_/TRDRNA2_208381_c0_seq1.p1  ORF type:complete len:254 (-),score=27.92 gnl/TRDRNA2_/TRDRNA2_208381_c0_seq1:186-947(-)